MYPDAANSTQLTNIRTITHTHVREIEPPVDGAAI